MANEIHHISIFDYGIGAIFFYKIAINENADLDEAVENLMVLKEHKSNNCYWSTMGLNDIVDETNETINFITPDFTKAINQEAINALNDKDLKKVSDILNKINY